MEKIVGINEILATALKDKDYKECERLITNDYPRLLKEQYLKNKLLSKLFLKLETESDFYTKIADNIIKWHKSYSSEHDTEIGTMVKLQIVIGLIGHSSKNFEFMDYWAYSLFKSFVPKNICTPDFEVKKAIYGTQKKQTNNVGENEQINNKRYRRLTYTKESKDRAYSFYSGDKRGHIESITNDSFLILKYRVKEKNKYYCNKKFLTYIWLSAAKKYFKPHLAPALPIENISEKEILQKKSEEEVTNQLYRFKENEKVKMYAFSLINKSFQDFLFNYPEESEAKTDMDFLSSAKEDEKDNVSDRNIAKRWRKNLNIYINSFHYFLNKKCREIILKKYIEDDVVFNKYFEQLLDKDIHKPEERCVDLWDTLSRKLISKHQNNTITAKLEFDVLMNKYKSKINDNHSIETLKKKFIQLIWNDVHLKLPDQNITQFKTDGTKVNHTIRSIGQITNEWESFVKKSENEISGKQLFKN